MADTARSVALGLRLGDEVLRSPNGVWYSATRPNGKPAGVFRFDDDVVAEDGVLDRIVRRVVAARTGAFTGVLPIVDLVEDSGRIWLVVSVPPVAEGATRTEEALLGDEPHPELPAELIAPVDVETVGEVRGRRRFAPVVTGLIGLAIVGAIGAGAMFVSQYEKKAPPGPPITVSAVTVHQVGLAVQDGKTLATPSAVTTSNICDGSVDIVATLETNGGKGTFQYEWDLTNSKPAKGTATFTTNDHSPQDLHLRWGLKLHGTGSVTAVFKILDRKVSELPEQAATLSYTCP